MKKGRLLHRMPDEIYKSNSTLDRVGIPLLLLVESFLVYMMVSAVIRGIYEVVEYFIFPALILAWVIPGKLAEDFNTRFELYENGFIPALKPAMYYLQRKEYFIPFSDIKSIKIGRGGGVCVLRVKGRRKELWVSEDWHDLEGYLKFLKVIHWKFPEIPLPNLDAISDGFYANINRNLTRRTLFKSGWIKYYAKKLPEKRPISGDEFLKLYYLQEKINPTVGPLPITHPPRPGAPLCPSCGGWLDFILEYNRWYCYTCQEYAPVE